MKVLLIGAGIGQLNLAKKIKQRGHFLIVFAYNTISEIINMADKYVNLDLYDYKIVLKYAQDEMVEAVVSDQHDIFAPLVAYVAEQLHIPGNTYDMLNSYCNKNRFRDNCDKLGIPVPRHIEVFSQEIPMEFVNVPFPWVVKPADSQSSVGVTKVFSKEDCVAAIKKAIDFSRTKSAIVEEFFTGIEFVVEGFIWKGQYFNLGFADRKYFNIENIFIPSQTIFPSLIDNSILDKTLIYEKKMAEYIKPNFAIVHSEYLYNPLTKEICIVESALRGGGVYISSHLIPLYSGIDINDILLDAVEGKNLNVLDYFSNKRKRAAAYMCFYLPEGEIVSVQGIEEILDDASVVFADFKSLKKGNKIRKMEHKGQRLGPIIISAKNREELEKQMQRIQRILYVKIKSQKNERSSCIWD